MLDKLNKYQIILASKSPRRKQLLEEMGLKFEVITIATKEDYPKELKMGEIPKYIAEKKADAFGQLEENQIVISADTVVCIGEKVLGKPKDEKEAKQMLEMLSGNFHKVFTGYCIKSKDKKISNYAQTTVEFKKLSPSEIDYYIKNYKPFDKAGSYGVQEWIGAIGIKSISGSYYNVVGLPTCMLFDDLCKF